MNDPAQFRPEIEVGSTIGNEESGSAAVASASRRSAFLTHAALLWVTLAVCAAPAQAGLLWTMQQVGADVVLTSTGSVVNPVSLLGIPDGLPDGSVSISVTGSMLPVVGSLGSGSEIGASYYENPFVSGPFNFGSGLTNTVATSTTGPFLQIFRTADPAQLLVDPDGLVAGAPFGVGTGATWAGSTLAALGVTPGTYVWTLDSRFNGDTITLQVLEPAEAPVPGTFALLGLGLAGLGALRRRIGIRVLAA